MRFHPYGLPGGSGFYGPFASRDEAERFLEHCHARGRSNARICARSSIVMTSDNSPVVLNAKQGDVDSFEPVERPELERSNRGGWQ